MSKQEEEAPQGKSRLLQGQMRKSGVSFNIGFQAGGNFVFGTAVSSASITKMKQELSAKIEWPFPSFEYEKTGATFLQLK